MGHRSASEKSTPIFDSLDYRFMRRALALARKGVALASPNPTVGCVIVRRGEIVGQGWHEYSRVEHAEALALREAGDKSRGATAYVTLEPCAHQGRTPPCAASLIRAGLRRVVVAMIDPNPGVSYKGIALLRAAGIEVELGLCEPEAQRLNESFTCHITTGRPLVVCKVGMSLDGRIATATRDSRWITSPAARNFGQRLRRQSDAVLVGIGTILDDDPELTYRGKLSKGSELRRVILDRRLRTPQSARIFRSVAASPVLIFCLRGSPAARRNRLERLGAELVPVPRGAGGLDLGAVLDELGKRKILGLLVEGGSEVHWSFLSHKLVDKFYFVIAPRVIGGRRAIPAVGGAGFETIHEAQRFKIARDFRVGSDLIVEAYPSYSRSRVSPWR